MNAYFVLGIITALWAVGLTAYGLTREDFPSSSRGTRAVIAVTILLVVATLAALFATTSKEHPRQEAEQEAAAAAEQQKQAPAGEKQQAGGAGGTVSADENEFNIDLDVGDTIDPGKYTFVADNSGRIEHNLAVQGGGVSKATPLIKPHGQAKLTVDLKPGNYKILCTVPGHAQQGMLVNLTVK